MWCKLNDGGWAIDCLGLVDPEVLKDKKTIMCIKREPIINKLKELGFDYDGSEKVDLVYPRSEQDLIVVISAWEGELPKSLLGDEELGRFVDLECRVYRAFKRDSQPDILDLI